MTNNFKLTIVLLAFLLIEGKDDDVFGYTNDNTVEYGSISSGDRSFGQPNWNEVTCSDLNSCSGYPDPFPFSHGFVVGDNNNCKWCPDGGPHDCGVHKQSPLNLLREVAMTGSPEEKDCPDWHSMSYEDDSCSWDDMKNQFNIARHALQVNIPQLPNGDIDCIENGIRRYPRVDYSKGFPNWFYLQRTEIQIPSQHHQEGHQYAAEVVLQHFYEITQSKNKLGFVAFFLQDYPDASSWPYLDKFICAWRQAEENVRAKCGLPPTNPYGRCKLFRNQEPTEEWLVEAGLKTVSPSSSTAPSFPTKTNQYSPSPSAVQFVNAGDNEPTLGPVSSMTSSPSTKKPVNTPVPTGNHVPPPYDCSDKKFSFKFTYHEMCQSSDPCCESTRSDSDFCWDVYDALGDAIQSACYHCCDTPKLIGPPRQQKSGLPKSIKCSSVGDVYRICKANSCCQNPRSSSEFCKATYAKHSSQEMEQICYYCCRTPQDVGPARRYLTKKADHSFVPGSSIGALDLKPVNNETSSMPVHIPPVIDCNDGRANYNRMCSSMEPCCGPKRSDTSFCWHSYDKLGNDVESACYHCCDEPQYVGPPAAEKNGVPKTIQCSEIDNPHVMCKEHSCCSNPRSMSKYCLDQYERYGDKMEQICHYCCTEQKELGPERVTGSNIDSDNDLQDYIPPGAVVTNVRGKQYVLRRENFEDEEYEEDEDVYFAAMHEAFKKRELQYNTTIHQEDYLDVEYWPYEWYLKVGTEYYFRYEGTEVVPPCFETVHWRPLKDPIQVHKRQIIELNRLLAWRRDPDTCQIDTAGILSDDGNSIQANRAIQYQHTQHRLVFCECKDWPSKFENDKEWCKNWEEDVNYDRFFKDPYSFDSNDQWLPY